MLPLLPQSWHFACEGQSCSYTGREVHIAVVVLELTHHHYLVRGHKTGPGVEKIPQEKTKQTYKRIIRT